MSAVGKIEKNSTKERLLKGATDWLIHHGAEQFSLRNIAKDLNTSARMLVYHFESKNSLLAAVLEQIAQRWMGEVSGGEGVRLPDQLRRLWTESLTSRKANKLHVLTIQLWARGLTANDPVYRKFMRVLSRGWTEVVASQLRAAGFEKQDSLERAMLCVAAIEGLLLHRATDKTLPASAAFEHLVCTIEAWIKIQSAR
jgi:AcrR family transcriptional regulator